MGLNFLQNSFASGELSPEVWGRTDRPFYKNGLEICRNFFPLLTGGCRFRPGSEYSIHARLNQDVWGLPFRFNVEQAYTLEFTDYKLRIHHDGGVILETAKTITGLVVATGVITSATHGFSTDDEIYIAALVGTTTLNKRFFRVVRVDANTFTLKDVDGTAIDTTAMTAYVSGGTAARVYEITSPYTAAEGPQIKYCGSADLMYLFHPDHEPRVLIRAAAVSWSIATYTRYSAEKNISGITNASPGVITTSTPHGYITGDRIYIAQVLGTTELNQDEYLVEYINTTTFSLKTLAGAAINTSAYGVYISGGKIALVRDVGLAITGVSKAAAGIVTIAGHGLATYDKVYIAGIVGMTELNGLFFWVKKIDTNTFSLTNELGVDIDTSGYTTWSSAGTVTLIHGLFTKIGDFPSGGGFYGGRLNIGGTDNDPDVLWASRGPDSETGETQYDDFSIGTSDTDGMVIVISSQNLQAMRVYWVSGTPKFMLVGASNGLYKVNGGADGDAITPTAIHSDAVSNVGAADMMPLVIGGQTYYIEQGGLTLRSFGYSLMDDSYKAFDKSVISDEITRPGIIQIAYAKGRPEIVYAVRSDGVLLSCTILESDDVAGWARHYFGGDGKVLSIVTESQTTGFDRVGVMVERTINSATRRYIEYLSEDPLVPDQSDYFSDEANEDADKAQFEKIVFGIQKQIIRMDSTLVRDTTQTILLTLNALSGDGKTATAASAAFTAADVGQYIVAKFVDGTEAGIAEIIGFTSSTVVTVNIKETFTSLTMASGYWYLTDQTITGLEHLEGETVGVLTDGAVHSDCEVEDGAITLDYPARYTQIGEKYKGFGRSLDYEIAGVPGTGIARRKTVEKVFVKLRNTLGGKFGFSIKGLYRLTELMFRREGSSYYDRPPALFSGLKDVPIKDAYRSEKHFYFLQDQPLPMEILAVIPSMDVGEEE